MMDERLLISELKNCVIRLRKILETAQKARGKGSVKIRPIFRVSDEDESLLERSENG